MRELIILYSGQKKNILPHLNANKISTLVYIQVTILIIFYFIQIKKLERKILLYF